jgi:DNA-binding transcriptional LysR family regulator
MFDHRLETFLTVCKTKNITKAATILNLTQPAVTKQINYLEEFYGVALLSRRGRVLELTAAGRILFECGKNMQSQAAVLERKLKNSATVVKKYIIGATLTIGEYFLPYIIGKYKISCPNQDLLMQVNNTETIIKKLLRGEIDLGLVEGPFDQIRFNYTTLMADELVLAAAPHSELGQKAAAELDEVLQNKLILREEGSGTRKVLETKLFELGYNPNQLKVYMEIGSLGAIKSLVELNLGYTIISKSAIQKEVAAGTLVMVPITGVAILRKFTFIYLKESPLELLNTFIKFAQQFVAGYSI